MARALSVGTRWALLYTLVTILALSVPIAFIYLGVKEQIEKDASLLLESYLAEVQSELDARPDRPGIAVAAFTERLGRIVPELGYGAAFQTPDGSTDFRVGSLASGASSSDLLIATRDVGDGVLQAAISRRSFAGSVERIRSIMLVSAPIALALSALCGAWMARRSLRPIASMTGSAKRISGENLAERIPLRGTNDELDRLAATLNGMFDRIAEAMQRLREFSADAAHQLKSPIATLRNQIEVTLAEDELPEGMRSVLEGLLGQVTELGTTVGSMLRLARSESGLGEGQSGPVDLAWLLDGVASLFHPTAEEHDIGLVLDLGEAVEVQGDVAWLRELFANLVQNAIAHTPAGGRIGISVAEKAREVAVRVEDSGEGIPAAERERIFDRFHRVSPGRGVPGTGLGLALVQQIALAHGGSVEVESAPGRGAAFTVRLPRQAAVERTGAERGRSLWSRSRRQAASDGAWG